MELQKTSKNDAFIIRNNTQSGYYEKKTLSASIDNQSQKKTVATAEKSSYSYQNLSMEFLSDDGDKVSISYQAVEFSKSVQQLQTETDPEKIKELAKFIKNEFSAMKKELFSITIGDNHKVNENQSKEIKKTEIPEYWGADQTSQRIVDFATSFYGNVEQKGEEYYNIIKCAIEEGFKQAKEMMGDLPIETESLINDTYNMVMTKLDSWAKDKNIIQSQTEA